MSLQWVALVLCALLASAAVGKADPEVHKKTFYSVPFELGPGDVTDRWDPLEWPQGHIGLRGFDAEVVDGDFNPVPLYDVYLHHWVVRALHVKKGFKDLTSSTPKTLDMSASHLERIPLQDAAEVVVQKEEASYGTCSDSQKFQFFGVGSETRHTNNHLPAPYVRSFGNPAEIPEGYEEAVYLNIHAIDTRGAVSKTSCLECLCESYGVVVGPEEEPLPEGYQGGMRCCYDKTHCAVKDDFNGKKKIYYLKYTMTWVDWDPTVIPVRSYQLDITDPRTSLAEKPQCATEYDIPLCNKDNAINGCADRRQAIGAIPVGGDLIYAAMHQHSGAIGGLLYYKNGPAICISEPIYGKGTEPGDEAGYVVGMTSCLPEPGSVKFETMKELTFEAMYSNEQSHTGVMSIFFILVADPVNYIEEVTENSL